MAMVSQRPVCGFMSSRTGCRIIGWIDVVFMIPFVLVGVVAVGLSIVGSPWCLDLEQRTKTWADAKGTYRFTGPVCVDTENWPNSRAILALVGLIILACCGLLLSFPCCLLHGVKNRKPGCMIPYMVFGVVKAALFLYFVMLAISEKSPYSLGLFGHFVIEVCKVFIVRAHYQHLTETEKDDRPTDIWREMEDRSDGRRAKVAIIDSQFLVNNNAGYTKLATKPT